MSSSAHCPPRTGVGVGSGPLPPEEDRWLPMRKTRETLRLKWWPLLSTRDAARSSDHDAWNAPPAAAKASLGAAGSRGWWNGSRPPRPMRPSPAFVYGIGRGPDAVTARGCAPSAESVGRALPELRWCDGHDSVGQIHDVGSHVNVRRKPERQPEAAHVNRGEGFAA